MSSVALLLLIADTVPPFLAAVSMPSLFEFFTFGYVAPMSTSVAARDNKTPRLNAICVRRCGASIEYASADIAVTFASPTGVLFPIRASRSVRDRAISANDVTLHVCAA